MQKFLNEKIQSWLALINILVIVGAVSVEFNKEHTSNAVQNEQILSIREQLSEVKTQLVRVEDKVDHLSEFKFARR